MPEGYSWLPWDDSLLSAHADVKFRSFVEEIDAIVFPSLSTLDGCQHLIEGATQAGHPGKVAAHKVEQHLRAARVDAPQRLGGDAANRLAHIAVNLFVGVAAKAHKDGAGRGGLFQQGQQRLFRAVRNGNLGQSAGGVGSDALVNRAQRAELYARSLADPQGFANSGRLAPLSAGPGKQVVSTVNSGGPPFGSSSSARAAGRCSEDRARKRRRRVDRVRTLMRTPGTNVVRRLREAGMDARVLDQSYRQEPVPSVRSLALVRVLVPATEAPAARRLLAEMRRF